MEKILVTEVVGFIGPKVTEMLLVKGYIVIGVDNLNEYYDSVLKLWRLDLLKRNKRFSFYKIDIENCKSLKKYFSKISI